MNIRFDEDKCFVCGQLFDHLTEGREKTMHHTLPEHLKPAYNVVVPVCASCHGKINMDDVSGMHAFMGKIEGGVKKLNRQTDALKGLIYGRLQKGWKK